MKHGTLHVFRLAAVAALALVASLAGAATVANGPYYATPSWDQTLPSSTRFIVLSNFNSAAVLDRETGLVWERDPVTAHPLVTSETWSRASFLCLTFQTGGRLGWRLPSVHELASLVDPSMPSGTPALPAGHPFLNVAGLYWSATAVITAPATHAYAVNFGGANVFTDFQSVPHSVWCVRGAATLSQQ